MAKKLFKSKTNFTLRRLHQSGNYGNIYERDYTTIVNSLDNPLGQIPVYNSPSFKLSVRAGFNGKKRYFYGNWNGNPNLENSNNWTLESMPNITKKQKKIELKPHTRRLTDFACYGSSSELIRSSLTNIVTKFPAELYVTNKKIKDTGIFDTVNNNGAVSIESIMFTEYKDYVIVDNPMFIDMIQQSIPDESKVTPLRYLCESIFDYNIYSGDTIISSGELFKDYNATHDVNLKMFEVVTPIGSTGKTECLINGDLLATSKFYGIDTNGNRNLKIEILCFYFDGNIIYLTNERNTGIKIRPNEKRINDFFDNLDDFEKVLLNRGTNYKSTFETYKDNEEYGWQMVEKTYKWPLTNGGWNISINGMSYSKYIEDLTNLAIGYDELYTNAIQRDMTHESVGNMDLTRIVFDNDYQINSSKLTQALNVVGRQFDEIKKYADNIKSTNTITYSQDKNTPDYFLTDNLENSGWEVKEILTEASCDITTDPMYTSRSVGFNVNDANNEFMRRLKLNSKEIFSRKGTKQGIEDLMAIFGYHSTDWLRRYYGKLNNKHLRKAYILSEHTYVSNGYSSNKTYSDVLNNVKRINQLKDSYSIEDINDVDAYIDEYQGIPVTEVTLTVPSDVTKTNVEPVTQIPSDKLDDTNIKYLRRNNEYYEWVGYRELNEKPLDYNGNGTALTGTTIVPEQKVGNKKYILLRLKYYQWSGSYSRMEERPSDANITTNYKTITNDSDLRVYDSSVTYVIYNDKYYTWDNNHVWTDIDNEEHKGSYVELKDISNVELKTKNVKICNAIPNVKDSDENIKYIVFRGDYYTWTGKYVVSGNGKPSDSTNTNTSYMDTLPLEQQKKKYVAINTYFIWEGVYKVYNRTLIVPWFDKEKKYDGDIYFQANGGWSRNDGKTDDTGTTETSVYGYSLSKIHYVATMEDLYNISYAFIDRNSIYYVDNEDKYYKIKDINNHNKMNGWEESDEETLNKVINIVDSNKGNNPHTGEYDNGYSYIESFGELFKNSTFENVRQNDVDDRSAYGFNIARYSESTKCMFFDGSEMINIQPLRTSSDRNKIKPHNFFGGSIYDESSSLSIINSKEFHITFDDAHRNFIEKDIIPYLSQIIPSTTIFSYSFEHITGDETTFKARTHNIICNGSACPIFGVI